MERLPDDELNFIKPAIDFASNFIYLPSEIPLFFEDCPSEMFLSEANAMESSIKEICINKQWYFKYRPELPANVLFFIFHELRHIHQQLSVMLMIHDIEAREPVSEILNWKDNFENYVRNESAETQAVNIRQEIEIDANAYAISLLNCYFFDDDNVDMRLTIPEDIADICDNRSKKYYRTKPELREFLKRKQAGQTPILIKRSPKIERNTLCPCGSGKKWKQCNCVFFH